MSATKPVATLGTSRARAAVKASAPVTAVVARIRSRRRRVIGFLQHAHQALAGHPTEFARRRSPDLQIRLAELVGSLADFEIMYILQYLEGSGGRRLGPAIFRRGHACRGLEGAVERPERLEAGIHRNGD